VDVSLTRLAKWRIKRLGGEFWIWEALSSNPSWALIQMGSSPPLGMQFDGVETDGVRLWFARDFHIQKLEVRWMPISGFEVVWEGTSHGGAGY